MPTHSDRALLKLLAECRTLASHARRAARRDPHSRDTVDDLRKATAHVDLAIESLNVPRNPGKDSRSLKARVSGLAGKLGRAGSMPTGGDRLADGIATLRRTRQESVQDGLSGFSSSIPLPELLGFLHVQGKSGTLRVTLDHEVVTIAIRQGELIHAYSDNSPAGCRLGEILVREGSIRQEQLETFLVYHSSVGGKLGKALELRELVTEEQLTKAVDLQMHALFARLFQASDARFAFRDDELPEDAVGTGQSVMGLLLEGARVLDENKRKAPPEPERQGPKLSLDTSSKAPGKLRITRMHTSKEPCLRENRRRTKGEQE